MTKTDIVSGERGRAGGKTARGQPQSRMRTGGQPPPWSAPASFPDGAKLGELWRSIMVTVIAGVQNIKPILLVSARSMGASRWQVFRHVIFPHMVPSFFAGMRLGMSGVLLGVLLAELYVSTAGIGYFTTLFTQNFDPTKLLGLVGMLAAMAIVLNEIVRRAEVRFSRWREG